MVDLAKGPMRVEVKGTALAEALTLIPVLRAYVSVEIKRGAKQEAFLFAQGTFAGTPASLERLRGLLGDPGAAEVALVSHDTLVSLFGVPVSLMALVLDPSGALGS
jgi:hypothetical protein